MAKLSLLDITQNILSSMDSDDVNSITDTEEALQVAEAVKEAYFQLVAEHDWPFLKTLSTLEGLGDPSRLTVMHIPDTINKIFWVRYNRKEVTYLTPDAFQELLDTRVALAGVVDADGFVINADPSYWTSFDDQYITFDGIDTTVESTLTSANSNCYCIRVPTWSATDTFVPDMPEKFFPTLLAEAKATCFLNFKQQANQREEYKAKRGRVRMKNEAVKVDKAEVRYNERSNYGRR